MKKTLIWTAVAVSLAAAAFVLLSDKEDELQFTTQKAVRGDIVETVTASGIVNPVNTVLVGTQVSGTIKRIYADFNSVVKKGQLIAEIDPSILTAQMEQAKANLSEAKANLEKAEADLLAAKRTYDRKKGLFSDEIIPEGEFEESETGYLSARAQVAAARAKVAQSLAAMNRAETDLTHARILSPVDGVVISRNVNVGQTVAASFQTPTLFTIAEDLTKMQIDANVDEADIGRIEVGQDVDFSVDAYADITFKGRVSQVRIAPIIVENVVTYDVVIMVDNPDLKLMPGMTANVSFIVSKRDDVLMVPNAALRFRPPDTEGSFKYERPGIWVLEKGKPARVEVQTGASDGSYTEILQGEIKEGREVIVGSSSNTENRTSRRSRFPRHL